MPAVTTYGLTGNAYIDGLLGDLKWATNSLTFSFPTSASHYGSSYGYGENTSNFGVLNGAQQATARAALTLYASVANLNFAEIAETSTQHADLRFAMSDKPSTAWAYFPTTLAEGGDAWFNKSSGYYNSPAKGNYAHTTFIHEIGHALGLEHAHEKYVMPVDRDSMEYTVMSYRSYVGASTTSGYTNETWGYAQSLMMYDIAALQQMYGANYSTNGGNTTYSWSPTTGEAFINGVGQGAPGANRIFQTVWDGGGNDTYDFSNYTTGVRVDLRPGEWTTTSTAQLAKLHYDGSKIATGNIANALLHRDDPRSLIENAVGGSGNDVIIGNAGSNLLWGNGGDDVFFASAGNDVIRGGGGHDAAVYAGSGSSYGFITQNGTTLIGQAGFGLDRLEELESFQFADMRSSAGRSPLEYVASHSDLLAAFGANSDAGFAHFAAFGWQEGRTVSFNGLEYIASHGDLIAAFGASSEAGARHFVEYGLAEQRATTFDGLQYIASHGDLIAAFGASSEAGARHYVEYGFGEGRSSTFDPMRYIGNYSDLQRAFGADYEAAARHYIQYGFLEGRVWDVDLVV